MPLDLWRLYTARDGGYLTFVWKVVDRTTQIRADHARRRNA